MGLECYGLFSTVYVKISDCNVACVMNRKTHSENVDLLLVSSFPPSQTQENKCFKYLYIASEHIVLEISWGCYKL